MTTEVRLLHVSDPFTANSVLTLTRSDPAPERWSGVVWLAPGAPHVAHLRTLEVALPLLRQRLVDHTLWLLIGHSVPQPDTRWTRVRKLWTSLRSPLPSGQRLEECALACGDGIRYFSGVRLQEADSGVAVDLLEEELASCVVAIPSDSAGVLDGAVASGWSPRRPEPDAALLDAICGVGGVVLWPVGAFDDTEGGIAAVARPSVIDAILV